MSINAETYGGSRPPAPRNSPDGAADPSPSAARLLEMTARETDQWRSDARIEAAGIVADARDESARLLRAAREEAERLVSTARDEAAQATNDARVEAYRVRQEIAGLQQVATEHRERLRLHLTEMLDRVESAPGES